MTQIVLTTHMLTADFTLYLATDRLLLGTRRLEDVLEAAIAAGVTLVQWRDKNTDLRTSHADAKRALAVTRRLGVPLIINDRLDLMLALDADGCHLGRGDLPLEAARRLAPRKILGYSVNQPEHLAYAESAGADYVGLGPAFRTSTKADTGPVLGPDGIRHLAALARVPCVAIGGITVANVAELRGTGIAGVCVISAVLGAADVGTPVRELRAVFGAD